MPSAEEIKDSYGISDEDFEALQDELAPKALRQKLAEVQAEAKKVPDLEAELEKFEKSPKVRQAFEKAGVDFEALSPLELQAVEGFADFEDAEKVASYVEANKLPLDDSVGETKGSEETPPAGQIAEHVGRVGRDSGRSKTTISSEDVAKWAPDKIARFREEHPDAYDQIVAGENVAVTAT